MPETELLIERATQADLPGIVAVYADDDVSGSDERWSDETRADYERGFAAIAASPDIELYVARRGAVVLGTIQVVFVPHVGRRGGLRCILESVFVAAAARGQGVGAAMVAVAEARARARGAIFVALSSNATRTDAHRFYERLGYVKSHVAFKKPLPPA